MDLETAIQLMIALGVGSITTKLVDALVDRFKNRDKEERDAFKRLDRESQYRRVLQERFHHHRHECARDHRAADGTPIDYSHMPTGPDDPIEWA